MSTSTLDRVANGCAAATMLVGLAVLAGWALELETMKSVLPGLATMKPNTALCFTLAGSALAFRAKPGIRLVCGTAVLILSGLTLVQDITGADFGIDELLFRDTPVPGQIVAPGRMSPATAVGFFMSATALLWVPRRGAAQAPALATGLMGFIAFLGYAYNVEQLYRVPGFGSMALHTAIAFIVLAAGILCACPDGVARDFASPNLGGQLARRLLPLALLIPLAFGGLQLLGQRAGLFGPAQGTALLASAMIFTLAALIWRTARSLEVSDAGHRRADEALREREALLRLFAEHAPAAIAMLDNQMRYVAASRRWLDDYGFAGQDLRGRSHYDLFPEIPERWKEIHRRCLAGAVEREDEDPFVRPDGRTQWIRWEVRPWYAASGVTGGIIIFSEDITARRETELALRESKERLDAIVNSAMDAIISADNDQRIIQFNGAAERMFGCSAQETLGTPLGRLIPERLRGDHEHHVRKFGTNGITTRRMAALGEISGRRANGEEFPLEASISQVVVGGRRVYTAILRDITERKRTENALRETAAELRAVSAKLAEAEEAERSALARELHDRIGGTITALGLNLTILREELSAESAEKVGERIEDSLELVGKAAKMVRGLMGELHPPLLDDYGLAAALRWYAGEFSKRSGIAATASGEEPAPRLGREKEIALFRITQEALSNVTKHAAASHVEISLEPAVGGVRLTIADDGRGFDPAGSRRADQSPSWGLRTMAERAAGVGGRLRVESAPGKGTRLVVELEVDS
jgi:PAS domain S-box-containing protein